MSTEHRSPGSTPSRTGIELSGFSKTFGTTRVLHDVSLGFPAGSITGVLGENGAGKSTLFKILAGIHSPDAGGRLLVDGAPVALPLTATSSAEQGFAFVHQDLGLANSLSVMENVFVGAMLRHRGPFVDWKAQVATTRRLLAEFGVDIDPHTRVAELTQAEKAVTAIARAVYARGRDHAALLVLDEPTANLTEFERERLFDAMRAAAARGTAIAFCTHRLDEVMQITDSVVVLRDGHVVLAAPTSTIAGERELARHILGREIDEYFPTREASAAGRGEIAVDIDDLAGGGVDGISLTIREGEIVGLTGLAGAGHDEVPELILGGIKAARGTVRVGGTTVKASSPSASTAAGIAMLPADRKRRSGVMSASVAENMTIVALDRVTRGGFVRRSREREIVAELSAAFDVRPAGDPSRPLSTLSGGNQQKVLIAKWAARTGVRCLILHEPTQGVDVGAKRAILEHVAALANQGMAVLLVSSEHEELAHLCDRVLVMRRGAVCAELSSGASAGQIAEQCYVAV